MTRNPTTGRFASPELQRLRTELNHVSRCASLTTASLHRAWCILFVLTITVVFLAGVVCALVLR